MLSLLLFKMPQIKQARKKKQNFKLRNLTGWDQYLEELGPPQTL